MSELHTICLIILTLFLTLIPGCRPSYCRDVLEHVNYPPQFALVFCVEAEDESDSRITHRSSQYVLEPDRYLRIALGSGATEDLFPRKTIQLDPSQVESLYCHINRTGLLNTHPDNLDAIDADVRYRVTITAFGRRHAYLTTPEDSPASQTLLNKLAYFGGIDRLETETIH